MGAYMLVSSRLFHCKRAFLCARVGVGAVIKVKIRVPHGTVYLVTDHFCLISVKHCREIKATVIKVGDGGVCAAHMAHVCICWQYACLNSRGVSGEAVRFGVLHMYSVCTSV